MTADEPRSARRMSKILGSADARWPLRRAIDALGSAARSAGRPSFLWLIGAFYPDIGLGLGLGWPWIVENTASSSPRASSPDVSFGAHIANWARNLTPDTDPATKFFLSVMVLGVCIAPLLFPLFLPLFRSIAGLAGVAAEHDAPVRRGFRDAWRSGKGLGFATGGLWLQCWLLVSAAALVFLGPVVLFVRVVAAALSSAESSAASDGGAHDPLSYLLAGPSVLIVACYALMLSILFQLALHSLAQNRRGVGSALMHAWRLVRADPWATVRTVLVDALLSGLFSGLWSARLALAHVPVVGTLALIAALALRGFVGVTRAGYWSRAYRGLGGLAPEDGVPGLERT